MRPWMLVLIIIGVLLVCLLRLRLGFYLRKDGLLLEGKVTVGWLKIKVFPRNPKKPKKPKAKKEKKSKKEKAEKKRGGFKPTFAEIKDAIETLLPKLLRALKRLGKGITVDPLRAALTLGGREDPADTAQKYGEIQALIWSVMPPLEKVIRIRKPYIHVGMDFDCPDTEVNCEVGIYLRLGTLLAVAFSVAIPAIGWLLRTLKNRKHAAPRERKPKKAA